MKPQAAIEPRRSNRQVVRVSSDRGSLSMVVLGKMLTAAKHLLLLLGTWFVGTACHEIVGHGFVGMAFGGTITHVHVLGLDLFPDIAWAGWQDCFGSCGIVGIRGEFGEHLHRLAGSMSTFAVASIAVGLLWLRSWSPRGRLVLAYLGIWWIDLLRYTLPTWGIRLPFFWHSDKPLYSEPYDAAVALGIPGFSFQAFVVIGSFLLVMALVVGIRRAKASGDGHAPRPLTGARIKPDAGVTGTPQSPRANVEAGGPQLK